MLASLHVTFSEPAESTEREVRELQGARDLFEMAEEEEASVCDFGMDGGGHEATAPRAPSPAPVARADEVPNVLLLMWSPNAECAKTKASVGESRLLDQVITKINDQIDRAMAGMGFVQNLKEEAQVQERCTFSACMEPQFRHERSTCRLEWLVCDVGAVAVASAPQGQVLDVQSSSERRPVERPHHLCGYGGKSHHFRGALRELSKQASSAPASCAPQVVEGCCQLQAYHLHLGAALEGRNLSDFSLS